MNPENLKIGATYYLVGFSDMACLIPRIETLEYLGERIGTSSGGKYTQYAFVDPHDRHQSEARANLKIANSGDQLIIRSAETLTDEHGLSEILELQGLIAWLKELNARIEA